jgi:hypothetical protein
MSGEDWDWGALVGKVKSEGPGRSEVKIKSDDLFRFRVKDEPGSMLPVPYPRVNYALAPGDSLTQCPYDVSHLILLVKHLYS